jgi:hypothetical protein
MNKKKKPGSNATIYDKWKQALLNNWIFALVVLVAVGAITADKSIQAIKGIFTALTPEVPRVTMSVTVSEGKSCHFVFPNGIELVQRSILDIGINNNSDRDIMLTSVKLKPEWITGSFFAGELIPTKQYDIIVDSWLDMVNVAEGYL